MTKEILKKAFLTQIMIHWYLNICNIAPTTAEEDRFVFLASSISGWLQQHQQLLDIFKKRAGICITPRTWYWYPFPRTYISAGYLHPWHCQRFSIIKCFTFLNAVRALSSGKDFVLHNQRFLSRIYPAGSRTSSSNYNPQEFWNVGSQLGGLKDWTQKDKNPRVVGAWETEFTVPWDTTNLFHNHACVHNYFPIAWFCR